jgi:poly(A) polymerase
MKHTFPEEVTGGKTDFYFNYIMKHIHEDNDGKIFEVWDKDDTLNHLLPYMEELKTIGKCKYHIDDAFTHMNYVYKNFKAFLRGEIIIDGISPKMFSRSIEGFSVGDYISLVAFTHDIGKYKAFRNQRGDISFKNHELIGAEIMEEVCTRYNFPKGARDIVVKCIQAHMYPLNISKSTEAQSIMKEFFEKYKDNVPYILALAYCDLEGKRLYEDKIEEKNHYRKMIEKIFFEYSTFTSSID